MKKLPIMLSILFLFACSDRDSSEIAKELNFYFSENETACAFIFYDVEGAPPLKIEDGVINYYFDERNIITTSSPLNFGWRSEESSGSRETNYYKQDGSVIDPNEIINTASGAHEIEYGVEKIYTVFYFNKLSCFSYDDDEDYKQFDNLVREIYKIEN